MTEHARSERSVTPWLRTYRKWTARVVLVALGALLVFGLSMLPVAEVDLKHPSRVWPLPRQFAAQHVIANLLVVLTWVVVGVACVVGIVVVVWRLLVRAELVSDD